ncbi:MAG: cytochrome P450 [Actinomycetota bacterium]
MSIAVEDLPILEPIDDLSIAEHLERIRPVREQSWIARSSRGLEVLSYEGCEAALKGENFFPGIQQMLAQMGLDKESMTGSAGRNMLVSEGADHLAVHRVVSRWFTPKRIETMRERVAGLVSELVAPITQAGGGEFMSQVARKVPGPVFCWMIGADPAEGDRLFGISEVILRAFSGDPALAHEVGQAAADMRAFVQEVIDAKRGNPGDDLLTIMLQAVDDGDLTDEDVHTLTFEMLSASTDNTANAAGLAVIVLARHPDQWKTLHADPAGLARKAVEECMRVEPRVRAGRKWAQDPAMLLDLEVPADTILVLDLVSAHHDPSVFPDPQVVDITRDHAKPQLNFGIGRHFCLGAALARMEMQVILERLSTDWAELALDGEPVVHSDARALDAGVRNLSISVTRTNGG